MEKFNGAVDHLVCQLGESMGSGEDGYKKRVAASTIGFAFLASILLSFMFQGTAIAHTGDYLISPVATTEIVVDGNITAVEWSEAQSVDLGAIPGNMLAAFLRVKHNDSFLFVAFDVTGDTSKSDMDASVIAFDTGHDGTATVGQEDQFFQGGIFPAGQAHLIFDGVGWTPHDAPYDESLPNHAGLASASSFGSSDLSPENHTQFEFRVPLALLGVGPGDVLGFIVAVIDYDTGRVSYWPQPIFILEMDDFGDLILDTPAQLVDVRLLPPSRTKNALPGDMVAYRLDVINRGTGGDDTFDLTASSSWPVSFWDAAGTSPLEDTGPLAPGAAVTIMVKVEVPADASGSNVATVMATSSTDANVSASALVITDLVAALFNPPHFDLGDDTDVPPDGLFNYLVVWANVSVVETGNYYVQGVLFDQSGIVPISFASVFASLTPGEETLGLLFSGQEIFSSGIDGPYLVLLLLYDGNFALVDEGNHTTRAYGYTEFQKPPASFAPPHSDSGLDTDGNGLFNYLVVDASINVTEAGMFYVDAFLHDPSYTLTIWTSNVTTLDVGLQTVPLWFDGVRINASDVDGPYTVELTLYDNFTFLDSDVHETAAYSHLEFEGPPTMPSAFATVIPSVDGVFSPQEWADANSVDLSSIPGNEVPGLLLVKNDYDFLYVAYDATGDTTQDAFDAASIGFDTDNDQVATDGREDQFVQGGWVSNDQAHYVYSSSFGYWVEEDSPYDPSLPNHMGLASAWGFGPSDNGEDSHRIYEFAIPLALLGAAPGDTIGFFGGSNPAPGLFDATIGGWSLWPTWNPGPLPLSEYGDLILATDTTPPMITISSPVSGDILATSDVSVSWSAADAGSGLSSFEVVLDGGAPVVLPATASTHTFTGVADGAHTVTVVAFDVADNSQSTSVALTVDTTPPAVSISSPLSGAFVATSSVEVTWVASDATSGVDRIEVSLDGGPPVDLPATVSTHTFTGVADGAHTVTVTAVDLPGNAQPASVAITVDATPPTLSIDSPASGETISSSSVEVAWRATDLTSGIDRYEVSLDGGPPVGVLSSESAHTFEGVADGAHTITVTAFDLAGNSAAASVDITVSTFPFPELFPGLGAPLSLIIVIVVAGAVGAVILLLVLRMRASRRLP